MVIYIMCVLRLRVDVIYINYRANGEYALSVIKILYWCNWKELNTITNLCVLWYDGFPRVSYVNIWFGLLSCFGPVDCSIVSDWSLSDSGSFGVISWLISSPPTFFDLKYIVVWVLFLQVCIQIRNRNQNMNCHYYCCYLLLFFFFDLR